MKKVYDTVYCTKCTRGKRYNPMLKTYRQCSVCGGTGKLKEFRGYERDDECPQDCMYCPDDIHAKCRDRCLVLPAWVDSSPEQAIKLLASPLWAIITLKRLEYLIAALGLLTGQWSLLGKRLENMISRRCRNQKWQ